MTNGTAELKRLRRAKDSIAQAFSQREWFLGVGLGVVKDKPGIVVNVSETAPEDIISKIKSVEPKAPIQIRKIGRIVAEALS